MAFQLSYLKSWKMKLWKCCTQYASKFGKLSSGHKTGKGQFSFQSKKRQCQKMLKLPHNCTHKWHPTPVLLPGKSHGRRTLVGCSPGGREESDTTERLHFHFHFHALDKEMATHSSVLAWRIPGMGEPGGLPSMGSHRVGHDWSDLAAAAAAAVSLYILETSPFPHILSKYFLPICGLPFHFLNCVFQGVKVFKF